MSSFNRVIEEEKNFDVKLHLFCNNSPNYFYLPIHELVYKNFLLVNGNVLDKNHINT